MTKLKLVLDTNVVIDFLAHREPFFEDARKLMICGRVGEFDLRITSSQITDLVYVLSKGGQKKNIPYALEQLKGLRTFIDVLPIGAEDVDLMLNSTWDDPEDFLIYDVAVRTKADALITRNQGDFHAGLIPVFDCDELFAWIAEIFHVTYDEVDF